MKLDKFRWRGSNLVPDEHLFRRRNQNSLRSVEEQADRGSVHPGFSLATADAMAQTIDVSYLGADNDYGKMFYNFWLNDNLRHTAGSM